MYLAEKTGKFLPKDMAKKYEVLQWLLIQLTGVGPMFGQWTHFKLFAPKGNDMRWRGTLRRSSASTSFWRHGSARCRISAGRNTPSPTSPPSHGRATTM